MSSWFLGQTDYLYFLYGLAFIGLGVVSYLLSRQVNQRLALIWLALFGFTHGTHDWLDLLTLIHQDVSWLLTCRWVLLAASFLFLAEFGRLNLVRQRGGGPGRWILGVLALLGCLGAWWGWNGLTATTRYALGLVGGLAAGLSLYNAARPDDQGGAWLKAAGLGFILYGLAIAATVPEAAFFPATFLNSQAFAHLTGLPAVLLQTFLAVAIAAMSLGYLRSTWSAELLGSRRYRLNYLHGLTTALVVILTAGWVLTQFLGHKAQEQVRKDTISRGNLIIQRLIFELEESEAAAKTMSGSPWIVPVLLSKTPQAMAQANSVLDRYQMRFGASPAYILDLTGECVASSNRDAPDSFVGHNYGFRPYFQEALKGVPGRYFAIGVTSKRQGFYAAHPVYDQAGKIVGVVAIKNTLILFQQGLQESDPAFFIDSYGMIFLSSRPNLGSQSLWPAPPLEEVEKLQFGIDQVKPVFSQVLTEGAEVKVEGRPYLFYRQYINALGAPGWSLVLLTPNNLVVFYRFLGIAITFIFGLFTLLAAGSNLSIREGAQRLVTSEARFRAMFDAAPDALMVYDHETRQIVDANPFMAQWLGYSPEELLTLKIDQVLASESWTEEGRGQSAAGSPPTYCQRYRKKDGSLVEVECTAANLPYGDRGRVLVIIRDVTERRRAEEALRESEARFRTLFENMSEGVALHEVIYNEDGQAVNYRILSTNPAFERHTGLKPAQVQGQLASSAYGTGNAPYLETYARVARSGRPLVFDTYSPLMQRHYHISITSPKWGQFVTVFEDITERQRLAEALRDNEQFLTDIFNGIQDGLCILDQYLNILRVNPALEQMRSPQPMVGRKCYEVLYGRSAPCDGCPSLQTFLTGKARRKIITEHRDDGPDRYVEIYAFPLLERTSGQVRAVIKFMRDVTEQRHAEAELLRFSKLESVATLAGGIAHDFNNILTAIMGNISLAMMDQPESGSGRERLTAAEKACSQAQGLARQLLTFATGGAPIKELLSLEKFIRETVSFAASGSQARCEFSFPDNLWAVEADPNQISQVFQNLVINAIQAMPAGGIITLQGENLEVGEGSELPLEAGRYVKITIRDQGIGIPADFLLKIFDPYFTTKQAGSGLGLATVYSIVNKHRGHITVKSKLGEGTTFNIYLPAREGVTIPRTEADREVLSGRGKILVMDDEELVRDVLKVMLSRLGYQVTLAKDGEAAIELFTAAQDAGEDFAAVILDLTVSGGMGGKAAIQQLLKLDPRVNAIVSSGYSDDPVMADFEKYGFSDVITKPYRIAELSRVLERVLNRELETFS